MQEFAKEMPNLLRALADEYDAGNSNISEEQALAFAKAVAHYPISKERAAIEWADML